MPFPHYTYILNIYDLQTYLVDNIFKRTWDHFILFIHVYDFGYCYLTLTILFNINHFFVLIEVVTSNAIQHYSFYSTLFISTLSNGSNYNYVIPIIRFWYIFKVFQVLLFNTNNSIQHYSLVCTHLNGSTYCHVSLTIQFDISHLFVYSLNAKLLFEP